MRKESRQSVFATQYFIQVYIVMLGLSLILALLGQFVLNDISQQSTSDAHVIRIVNQQRVLSQEVSKSAQVIEATILNTDFHTRQHYKEALSVTLTQWQQAHGTLHDRSTISKNDGETTHLLSSLELHYHTLLNASYTLLSSINTPLHTSHAMITTPVQSILHEEPTYLLLMSTLITRYQHDSENRVAYLKYIDLSLLVLQH